MNRRILAVILGLASLSRVCPAQNESSAAKLPTDFYRFKAVYVDQIKVLEDRRDQEFKDAAEKHINALQSLEKSYQLSGELKPLLSVREERNRFAANPNVRDIKVTDSPPMLGTVQQQYIDRCKEIQLSCAQGIIELSQHYKRRLTVLQKDLTREGRIDEALAVLSKVDEIDSSPEILAARKQIASGGSEPIAVARNLASRTVLDMESLSTYFHGEVVGWNSMTQEITIKYDFKDEKQLADWEGASIDPLRVRMVCDHKVVWFATPFKSVSRIDCDASIYEGNAPIRIVLGRSLYVDLQPGADGKALIYQNNPAFPVMESHGGAQPYMKYACTLSIQGDMVKWSMGSRSFPESRLQQAIMAPVKIGFGHEDAKTMFGNIAITGILSAEAIDSIR